MINLAEDVLSLSYFKRNTAKLLGRLKKSKRPMVLTVNGKARMVVQDPAAYQETQRQADRTEMIEFLKRSLADVEAGRTRPLNELLDELERSQ